MVVDEELNFRRQLKKKINTDLTLCLQPPTQMPIFASSQHSETLQQSEEFREFQEEIKTTPLASAALLNSEHGVEGVGRKKESYRRSGIPRPTLDHN